MYTREQRNNYNYGKNEQQNSYMYSQSGPSNQNHNEYWHDKSNMQESFHHKDENTQEKLKWVLTTLMKEFWNVHGLGQKHRDPDFLELINHDINILIETWKGVEPDVQIPEYNYYYNMSPNESKEFWKLLRTIKINKDKNDDNMLDLSQFADHFKNQCKPEKIDKNFEKSIFEELCKTEKLLTSKESDTPINISENKNTN
ncbi:unnamed protein product [Mytilus edulis]|uniref:Uncharacterized protein n=1 Tax=Mytilus edulis TaxID=6550 RepID=A0A8S3SZ19_MYTED|nr:unnamed protein product [Mytilus edulis]